MNPVKTISALLRFAPSALLLLAFGCVMDVGPGIWNNPHDPQGTNFHPPTVGLKDTAIHDGATGWIRARASSTVSTVAAIEWVLDGVRLATTDSVIPTTGWSLGAHVLSVQATDAMGIAGPVGSVGVWIGNQPPRLQAVPDSRVGSSQSTTQILNAFDDDGTIASIAWDTVYGQYSQVSNTVPLPPLPDGGTRTVYWKATDNEGAAGTGSFRVGFVPPPQITLRPSGVGMTGSSGMGSNWNVWLKSGSAMAVEVSVTTPGFGDELVAISAWGGGKDLPCKPVTYWSNGEYLGFDWRFACTETSPSEVGKYSISYGAQATNRYGQVTRAGMSVTVHFD